MSIINSIKSAFIETEKPAKATNEEMTVNELINFLNLEGTPEDELSEATYFACMKVLSEGVGKLPLKLLRYTDNNGVETAREHPLHTVAGTRPNQFMGATTFWSTVEFNRNHYGNAYVLIDGYGTRTQLWILPSNQVKIWYDDKKAINNVPDIYYVYQNAGKKYVFTSEQILHFKASNTLDGIVGVSVREQLASTIKGNAKSQELLNKMYENGFTAKAVFQYTGSLNDEKVKKLTKGVEDFATGRLKEQGVENIIPIPLGSELTPLNIKLADNQFVEIKQYSALQIASAFGIKPYQIGDYTKASYASAEAQQLSFYIETLLYIIKQYEEELTFKLLTDSEVRQGYHFKFNVAVILRADHKTQIDTLSKAVNSFIYTPNEARNLLDMEDMEGGDQLLGNGASIPITYAGMQYVKELNQADDKGGEPPEPEAEPDEENDDNGEEGTDEQE